MNFKIKSVVRMSVIFVAAAALTLTACRDLDGNEQTNPIVGGQDDDCTKDATCILTPYVLDQANLICTKVNSCLGLNDTDPKATCMNLMPVQNGLDTFVTTSARNYNQLNHLYFQKKINVDGKNWEQCMAAIDQLTCDSSVFTNAFSISEPHNYSQIHQILSASEACALIYTPKQ